MVTRDSELELEPHARARYSVERSLGAGAMGEVVVESGETFTFIDVDTARNEAALQDYPGYLAVRSDVYAEAWGETLARPLVRERG